MYVFQAIFEILQPKLDTLLEHKDIISAVAIICLVEDFHISLNQRNKNILFHCFVLKGDNSNRSCEDYKMMVESYKDMIPLVFLIKFIKSHNVKKFTKLVVEIKGI